jgi:hypothetical protein
MVKTQNCEYLPEFSWKFEMVLMGYSEACEKLIHNKNLKLNISFQTPFKPESLAFFPPPTHKFCQRTIFSRLLLEYMYVYLGRAVSPTRRVRVS